MSTLSTNPITNPQALLAFEQAMPFAQRCAARSVFDLFEASAQAHPDRIALTMLMTGAADEQPRRVTYQALLQSIRQAANLFTAVGGPRPGVAYMLPSLIETHVSLWAAETAGFAVPINFLLQTEHIADLIRASGATILVALGAHPQLAIWDKAQELKQLLPSLILIRVAPPGTEPVAGVIDFHAGLMEQPHDHLVFGAPGRDDEVAAYFHTGGTTGAPKLVAHTHRNQLVAAYGGALMLHLSEHDVLTSGFPLFHVAGTIVGGLSFFMMGAEILILSPAGFRNPAMIAAYWRIVARYGATMVAAVPTALGALLDVPLDGADLSSVRLGICGAASLPRAVGERFETMTGKRLHEILGMTESAGLISIDFACGERTAGSVGYPLPYTRVAIRRLQADGSLGAECEPHEIGVLTVTGPTVSRGYLNPQQNTGVFDDGVLNSGDLAYANEEGCVFVAGRAKDLIIRGGHNIDPAMIENAMSLHPAVGLVAAVAQPDAYAGELPLCYLSLRPGMAASAAELKQHAQAHIAERPAWPKEIIVLDALPLTNVGKIYKPALRVDACSRLVHDIVHTQLGFGSARIAVKEGGSRGLRVTVIVTASASKSATEAALQAVRQALAAYVFESIVSVDEAS